VKIERRKSVRLPVQMSHQEGELRFGQVRLSVQLLDQSADGFAVITRQAPGVKIGAAGLLGIGEDWYEIYLSYSMPLESSSSPEIAVPEAQEQIFRLGLCRIRDTLDPDMKEIWWPRPLLADRFRRLMTSKSTMFGFGLIFVFFMVVLPTAAVLLLYHGKGNAIGDVARLVKRIGAAHEPGDTKPYPADISIDVSSPASSSVVHSSSKGTFPAPLGDYLRELRAMIRRMPGAEAFLMPNVIQELGLTDQQQRQIQDIIDSTEEAVILLGRQSNGESSRKREKIHQELLDIARSSALKVLTKDQQERWKELSAENTQNENAPKNDNEK
jgi:hypothetical protein